MHGVKGFLATFKIETDRIHYGESTDAGIAHCSLVVNIGFDRKKAGVSDAEEFLASRCVP